MIPSLMNDIRKTKSALPDIDVVFKEFPEDQQAAYLLWDEDNIKVIANEDLIHEFDDLHDAVAYMEFYNK